MSIIEFHPPTGSVLPADTAPEIDRDDETPDALYGKTYAFDFTTGDFFVDGDTGKVVLADADGAVLQGLTKQLQVPRYVYMAYGPNYGNEGQMAMGEGVVGATAEDLALSYADECIGDDPRVDSTIGLDVDVDTGAQTVRVIGTIADIYGTEIELDVTYGYELPTP